MKLFAITPAALAFFASTALADPMTALGEQVKDLADETETGFTELGLGLGEVEDGLNQADEAFEQVDDGFHQTRAEFHRQSGMISAAAAMGSLVFDPTAPGLQLALGSSVQLETGDPGFAVGVGARLSDSAFLSARIGGSRKRPEMATIAVTFRIGG